MKYDWKLEPALWPTVCTSTGVFVAATELHELLRDVRRAAVRGAAHRRIRLHRRPDLHAAQSASTRFDHRIGRVVPQVARAEPGQLRRHRLEDRPQRVEQARFPDEVDRVDAVPLPPVDVFARDSRVPRSR